MMNARLLLTTGLVASTILAIACTLGAEVYVVSASDFSDGAPFGVAATRDGQDVFTADGSHTLSAFTPSGDIVHWAVNPYDQLHAITGDPSHNDSIRALHDSGIHRVTASVGAFEYHDTIALPPGPITKLCDVSVDLDGDAYLTTIRTWYFYGTPIPYLELSRFDAAAGTWSDQTILRYTSKCGMVSADPATSEVAALVPGASQIERRNDDTLELLGSFTAPEALDIDVLGGTILTGNHGNDTSRDPHNYTALLDSSGNTLDSDWTSPFPSSVHLADNAVTGEVRAWVAGDDLAWGLTYLPVNL